MRMTIVLAVHDLARIVVQRMTDIGMGLAKVQQFRMGLEIVSVVGELRFGLEVGLDLGMRVEEVIELHEAIFLVRLSGFGSRAGLRSR